MRIVESLFFFIICALAFLKCFAISRESMQITSSLIITILVVGCIFFNLNYLKKDIPLLMLLYLMSLFFSSIYIRYNLLFDKYIDSLLFPLLFISSYVYFRKYPEYFNLFAYLGIVGLVLAYFNLLRLSSEANLRVADRLVQSNAGNTLVALLPYALLWKNKYVKFLLIALVFYGCLISLKRSAFVIFVSVIFIYYLLNQKGSLYNKTIIYGLAIVFVSLFVLPYIDMAQPLLDRLSDATEDGGSGRDLLVQRCLGYQFECGFPEWVLGNGYCGFSVTSALNGYNNTCAHNDFVEVLYDAGIIAYSFYIVILVSFFKKVKSMYKSNNKYIVVFTSCLAVFTLANIFVCTFVHIWYYLPLYCLFGATLAVSESNSFFGPDEKTDISNVY